MIFVVVISEIVFLNILKIISGKAGLATGNQGEISSNCIENRVTGFIVKVVAKYNYKTLEGRIILR